MSRGSEKAGRKLAAIMFTDMVGFTALTQTDEDRALRILDEHNSILRPLFPRFSGRVVKTIGDSFLVEFDSALNAVNCAIEIQEFLHDYNRPAPEDWKIRLRIGIHLGDVVRERNDIFGDAVNIASRIEPLAEPDGICISQQVFDQVHNKISRRLEKIEKTTELKNVRSLIGVYKILMPWEIKTVREYASGQSAKPRIAILPFVNMSPDPADEYFADGLTEELISKLSFTKGLAVIARTSVMKYKKKEKGVSEIGKELGVRYIVEGSVRKAANKIRVTAQLVQTDSEEHLWASNYDRGIDDIFAVQSDIATKISESLPGNIAESTSFGRIGGETQNIEAYSLYLRGKQLLNERETDSLLRALELLKESTRLDPSFARAYVEIGICYAYLGMKSYLSFDEGFSGMKSSAIRALEIDQNLAEGHALLSFVGWAGDDHAAAEKEATKAIELNPNLSDAYVRLAYVKATFGHLDEAIRIYEIAQQLDPLSSEVVDNLGMAYFWSGREGDAMALWEKNRSASPYIVCRNMVEIYLEKKEFQKAEEEIKRLEKLTGEDEYTCVVYRGQLLALEGKVEAAKEVIKRIEASSFRGRAVNDRNIGIIRYYLGDKDAFFAAMLRACDDHVLDPFKLRYSLLLAEARRDPRYRQVLEKNGIYAELSSS